MASRTGMFLKAEQRIELIQELKRQGELLNNNNDVDDVGGNNNNNILGEDTFKTTETLDTTTEKTSPPLPVQFGTGCLCCGEDDDHANLLLCEACNDEYHTYCLDPPLKSVPTGDWVCGTFFV